MIFKLLTILIQEMPFGNINKLFRIDFPFDNRSLSQYKIWIIVYYLFHFEKGMAVFRENLLNLFGQNISDFDRKINSII